MARTKDEAVFSVVGDSVCDECGADLWKGSLLRKEGERALCMPCADLDHLVFVGRGDAALTRRASKYSPGRYVVLRFSRSRKRYERQGILVEEQALARAETECLNDADAREARREREAIRRAELDEAYVAEFAERLRDRFPGCDPGEARRIAEHACRKYSGRVGRTAGAKAFDPEAIDLAVRAHVRHAHTDYDERLWAGEDRHQARRAVGPTVDAILTRWMT